MNDIGHVYVLANSALPGLVKVGKTTRSPAERAQELSSATALPTPFIVVYEQLFEDCSAAESFVHTHLASNGFRVSDNREFFNAPANEIIRAIMLAPGAIDGEMPQLDPEPMDDLLGYGESDELDSLTLSTAEISYPWSSIFEEAEHNYYGLGDHIQDYAEALRLFRQAAKLGALPAYRYIGEIYEYGHGVRQDQSKALDYYKEGAKKGSVYCYWAMGILFTTEHHQQNADKCFSWFLKNMHPSLPDGQHLTELELDNVIFSCFVLLLNKFQYREELSPALSQFFAERASEILECAERFIERKKDNLNTNEKVAAGKAVQYLKQYI